MTVLPTDRGGRRFWGLVWGAAWLALALALLPAWTPGGVQAAQEPRAPEVLWQQKLPFATRAPLVGDGLVYAFSGGDAVALDAGSGAVAWRYAGAPLTDAARSLGCACQNAAGFAGEQLYVVGGGDTLAALDTATGAERWRRVVGQAIAAPPVAVADLAVLASGDQQGFGIHGLAAADGAPRWEVRAPTRVLPGLVAADGLVFAPLADGTILALDAAGGEAWRAWATDLPEPLSPEQVGGGLLVLRTQAAVVALDTATGEMRWSFAQGGFPSRPLSVGGAVYGAAGDGRAFALDAATGQPVWERALGALPTSEGALVRGDTFYLPTFEGTLAALDAATGAPRWTAKVGQLFAPPTVANGALYVATITGELYILDAASGTIRASVVVGGPALFSPAVAAGRVYVAADADDGTVLVGIGLE